MANFKLSKSTFIRGLQCEKSLYLYKHHNNLRDPIPSSRQAIFDQGTEIGLLAQELFPKGADASPEHYSKIAESAEKTAKLIEAGETIIYEATFIYNDVLVALDILVKDKEGWKAYEVKSSTSVSETYIKDAAIQYYVLTNAGIDLKDIAIVHINKKYVRKWKIDVHQFFKIESVYAEVMEFLPNVADKVERFKEVIAQPEVPTVEIGPHCSNPYNCDFKGTCWKHIPDNSVFDIANLRTKKKFELYNQGIVTFGQIDLDKEGLNSSQKLQVQSEILGMTAINCEEIRRFAFGLKYPLHYLDFETINPAIPVIEGTRPYQQIAFQYSLHKQETPYAPVTHKAYLANSKGDPRVGLVKRLIEDCDAEGDILVYNIGFERSQLMLLADLFPDYGDKLLDIASRLKDLMIPFRNKWYYTPKLKGSYSIKDVLPVLLPDLSYDNLDIKEGSTASYTFLSMVKGTFEGDVEKTRQQLLDYCNFDTLAMVKLFKVLKEM